MITGMDSIGSYGTFWPSNATFQPDVRVQLSSRWEEASFSGTTPFAARLRSPTDWRRQAIVGPGHVRWFPDVTEIGVTFSLLPNQGDYAPLLEYFEGTIGHFVVMITPHNGIRIGRGVFDVFDRYFGTPLGMTEIDIVRPFAHASVEVLFKLSPTVGEIHVKVDGVLVLSLTNQNTQNGGSGFIDRVRVGALAGVSDVVWWDATGPKNNTFLGDVRVDYLAAASAGTNADFTPSSGANWQNVRDIYNDGSPSADRGLFDDHATYNDGGVVGDVDSYGVDPLPHTPSEILAVMPLVRVAKSDAGPRTFRQGLISGSTTSYDSAVVPHGGFRTYPRAPLEDDPNTGTDWTEAGVEAAEVLVEVVS